MGDYIYGKWVVDLEWLMCWNGDWGILVGFEKQGTGFAGKIDYMPCELAVFFASLKNGAQVLEKVVSEAENAFMKKYIEADMDKNGIPEVFMNEIEKIECA